MYCRKQRCSALPIQGRYGPGKKAEVPAVTTAAAGLAFFSFGSKPLAI
jgi:hypothetical protein